MLRIVTYNGGVSWQPRTGPAARTTIQTPIRHDSAPAGTFSIAFRDARKGFAVGGGYRQPAEAADTMIRSRDGGRTWIPVTGPRGFRSAVWIAGRRIVVTGPGGANACDDFGARWRAIGGQGFHALSGVFASGTDGGVASNLK